MTETSRCPNRIGPASQNLLEFDFLSQHLRGVPQIPGQNPPCTSLVQVVYQFIPVLAGFVYQVQDFVLGNVWKEEPHPLRIFLECGWGR